MSAEKPSDHRLSQIGLLLAFVGGFADAGSYVLATSFTGHVTGNALLAAVHLVSGKVTLTISSLVAVTAFLCGTAGGRAWHQGGETSSSLLWPLVAEVILIVAGVVVYSLKSTSGTIAFVTLVCFALGVQNGTLHKLGSVSIHSTYITGMTTSLIGASMEHKPVERSILARTISLFMLGALCGAACTYWLGSTSFALILLPLAVALGVVATARIGNRPRRSPVNQK